MRIASLVPSATEALYALGLGSSVVGVTHECDHPPEAAAKSHLTRTVVPEGLSAAGIDRAVRDRTERGEALYELNEDRLAALEPDLVVTQAVCAVCAVSFDEVRAVAARIPSSPRVVSMDPSTLGEVLEGIRALGEATGASAAAEELLGNAARRLDRVRDALGDAPRPRVAALEWLDPAFAGGHWVPQMIELAGGTDVLGLPGEHSRVVEWGEIEAASPQVVVAMPCGYDAARSAHEALDHRARLTRLGAPRVVAVDAAGYFSRPGPRLVDGVELLAGLLHPDRVAAPPADRALEVDLGAAAVV